MTDVAEDTIELDRGLCASNVPSISVGCTILGDSAGNGGVDNFDASGVVTDLDGCGGDSDSDPDSDGSTEGWEGWEGCDG
eukprot:gene85-biopygen8860